MNKVLAMIADWRRRRQIVMATAAAFAVMPLAACDTSTNLAQITATIQQSCGFVTSYQSIVPIIVSLIGDFNAGAGAAATVATATATQVIQEVCGAVQVAKASGKAPSDERVAASVAPPALTVVVNGVPITGTLVGAKTLKKAG